MTEVLLQCKAFPAIAEVILKIEEFEKGNYL
ncbi:hypothetical protein EV200_103125 [Pedobacter psychrotolerans]|uniref:Uncharacterized protein n=1 Tax=Pedobacter psychrotolerans TaxID=1843235 RepID=A0A4R2HFR3_9SPHI|nr:hypothetical protein EV200_103125 [Pedobacter psychrotolerans]